MINNRAVTLTRQFYNRTVNRIGQINNRAFNLLGRMLKTHLYSWQTVRCRFQTKLKSLFSCLDGSTSPRVINEVMHLKLTQFSDESNLLISGKCC